MKKIMLLAAAVILPVLFLTGYKKPDTFPFRCIKDENNPGKTKTKKNSNRTEGLLE